MNRATIKTKVLAYLNQQDTFSMPYAKLRSQFPGAETNFDVAISRMEGVEVEIEKEQPFTVTLKEPFREKRR